MRVDTLPARRVDTSPRYGRPTWVAMTHVLYVMAIELEQDWGPVELRRAVRHLVKAVDEVFGTEQLSYLEVVLCSCSAEARASIAWRLSLPSD